MHATGAFTFKRWDEKPYSEIEGGQKLSRVEVVNAFQGDIEGEGTLEYLLFYAEDSSGSFIGLEHLVGQLSCA